MPLNQIHSFGLGVVPRAHPIMERDHHLLHCKMNVACDFGSKSKALWEMVELLTYLLLPTSWTSRTFTQNPSPPSLQGDLIPILDLEPSLGHAESPGAITVKIDTFQCDSLHSALNTGVVSDLVTPSHTAKDGSMCKFQTKRDNAHYGIFSIGAGRTISISH